MSHFSAKLKTFLTELKEDLLFPMAQLVIEYFIVILAGGATILIIGETLSLEVQRQKID
jgi:hypothetical protein